MEKRELICMLLAIAAYMLFVLGIGIWFSKRNKTSGDFYLGGRKLGPFVTAMSAEASDMSSWLLMGLPGVAYLTGLADAAWTAIGLAVGTYVNWLVVAKRIRRYSERVNAITIPEFFTNRFHDKTGLLTTVASLIIIVFFVPYTASGFAACGKVFSTLFGNTSNDFYFKAMLISAVVIVLYTTLGGFLAASTSDFIQSIIMTLAIFMVMGIGVSVAGGFSNVFENAKALPGYLSMNATYDAASGSAKPYGLITILSTLAWGLGYFGMPHVLLRFMAIDDEKKLKLSRRVASVWVVISMAVAIFVGIIGYTLVKEGVFTLADKELVFIENAKYFAQNGVFMALLAGVVLSGILAATMSTADSQLLAASSSVSEDLLKRVFCKNISSKTAMIFARVTVVVISVIAVFIARKPDSSVFEIVSFAWAGFGATFGPVMIMALFWKRSNTYGALAGLISGGISIFVWKFKVRPLGGAFDIYELLPAFLIACLFIIAVSLLTPAPGKEIEEEFESVRSGT